MTFSEILDNKIESLKEKIEKLKAGNLSKKEALESELEIITQCEEILTHEELILEYDFTKIIEILNNRNLTIDNIEEILNEIKQVINVKKMVNMPDMPFSDLQTLKIKELKLNIIKAKENIKKQLEELTTEETEDKRITELKGLKEILAGTGRRKYYTEEMVDTLSETIDLGSISDEEFDSIMEGFYSTRNLSGKSKKDIEGMKEPIENIINLFKEFLGDSEFEKDQRGNYYKPFAQLLKKYEEEISLHIDIENTRNILQFFKDKGILDEFRTTTLLKVSVFADYEYVRELYEKIMKEYPEQLDIYFEDEAATLWVCNSKNMRKSPFRINTKKEKGKKGQSLYSQCHTITEQEFRDNIVKLRENSQMFDDKVDLDNFGAYLKTKLLPPEKIKEKISLLTLLTKPAWILRKNTQLCQEFRFGEKYRIPVNSLVACDIENKIHLAIELGLLNPPMDEINRAMDKDIETSEAYSHIVSRKRIYNDSIRDYFQRNIYVLASLSINYYGFLKYKLNELGRTEFFNYFFHPRITGTRNKAVIDEDKSRIVQDEDRFIKTNFITDFYNQYIESYDMHDAIISNYTQDSKLIETDEPYYDINILNEPLIQELEKHNTIIDHMTQNDTMIEVQNEYVYKFGNTLISRYKVLHNATILRKRYGYLDQEMLMTSIVRNSFLTEEEFENIKDTVYNKGEKKL